MIHLSHNKNVNNIVDFTSINPWRTLVFILILFLILSIITNLFFATDSLYYQSLGEVLSTDRIAKLIAQIRKWQWLGYAFIPIVAIIRISFTATCIYIGSFIANIKVDFRNLFKVALFADFIFVLAALIKLIILIFFKEVNTLEDLQFQPFALANLFDTKTIDQLLVYPLALANLFELLYWLALAWLLTGVIKQPMKKTLKTVASSYGTGLLLWVLFIMFLNVSLS